MHFDFNEFLKFTENLFVNPQRNYCSMTLQLLNGAEKGILFVSKKIQLKSVNDNAFAMEKTGDLNSSSYVDARIG